MCVRSCVSVCECVCVCMIARVYVCVCAFAQQAALTNKRESARKGVKGCGNDFMFLKKKEKEIS